MAEVVGCVYELLSLLLQDTRGRVSTGQLTADWLFSGQAGRGNNRDFVSM